MTERITKIVRHTNNEIEVQYTVIGDSGGPVKHGIRSSEVATDHFYKLLANFKGHLQSLLDGIPDGWMQHVVIRGIEAKWNEEMPEISIVAEKELRGLVKPLKIKTPATEFTKTARKAFDALCDEAMLYVQGQGSQVAMEFPKPSKN